MSWWRAGLTLAAACVLAWDERRRSNALIHAMCEAETRRYERCIASLDAHKLACRRCRRDYGLTCPEALALHRIYYP